MWGRKKQQREANLKAQKRKVATWRSRQALLAQEYSRDEKPDYDIFDFTKDGEWQRQNKAREEIRSWVRYALINGMSYDDIKKVVIGEFRLHRDAMEHRKPPKR